MRYCALKLCLGAQQAGWLHQLMDTARRGITAVLLGPRSPTTGAGAGAAGPPPTPAGGGGGGGASAAEGDGVTLRFRSLVRELVRCGHSLAGASVIIEDKTLEVTMKHCNVLAVLFQPLVDAGVVG
jgi:hypothetical protein